MGGYIGGLLMPDMYGAFQQGAKDGQAALSRRTLSQYMQPALAGDQGALAKIAGVDPDAALKVQQSGQDMQQNSQKLQENTGKLQDQDMTRLGQHARMITALADSGDIEGAKQLYGTIYPEASKILGPNLPSQLDPSMLPHMKQIAQSMDPQAKKDYIDAAPGHTYLDPSTMKPVYSAPAAEPKDSGEVATLKALQGDPGLMATYQKMHPRPAAGATGGFGRAPSGYRFTPNGDLEAITGGPADSSGGGQGLSGDSIENAAWQFIASGKLPAVGRGDKGIAQRTAVQNRAAAIAKAAGISPAELQTVPGRNKALQGSLANLQKRADIMETSEKAFQNNTATAMQLSDALDRSGSPVVNKWVLGGKEALGDPQVNAFDAAIRTMATDYARIMSGQSGAGGTPISTTEDAVKLIRRDLGKASFKAVVDVLNKDIQGQQSAVHGQRGNILGAMQQLHDDSAPDGSVPSATPSNDADPLGLLK